MSLQIKKIINCNFPLRKQIPNLLTIVRIFLVIPIILLLLNQNFSWALSLFLIAAITDALDGYIAKKTNSASQLGSILDPIADKLLLVSSFISLTYLGQIPIWLCILVVVRDLVIIAAVTGYFFVSENTVIKPSLISKINTLFQILFVIYLVSINSFNFIFEFNFEIFLIGLVATTTILSGFSYAISWIYQAYSNLKSSKK